MPAVMPRRKPAFRNPTSERKGPVSESASPDSKNKPEAEILFQNYFKSVGPRTYAAQVKRAGNGNHFLVLTEGKRDDASGDVRKTRLFIFSEDFVAFFRMLHETAKYIRENPVPDEVRGRRQKFWAKHNGKRSRSPQETRPPGASVAPEPASGRQPRSQSKPWKGKFQPKR